MNVSCVLSRKVTVQRERDDTSGTEPRFLLFIFPLIGILVLYLAAGTVFSNMTHPCK